jgi:hypothetical protein
VRPPDAAAQPRRLSRGGTMAIARVDATQLDAAAILGQAD